MVKGTRFAGFTDYRSETFKRWFADQVDRIRQQRSRVAEVIDNADKPITVRTRRAVTGLTSI